ncbi:lipoate--protein ligase family protein [Brasilonema octagenarum UFV-E1]|uniref:Lipoate--protein ligase family protein n=1 Tax=Brasilonema sennae CENA114 TaxID=415709 RepID=A0A856MQ76_9CYAN|nr:biotin/lipoate A/B protein ligase family protein [Brasilonema sennae]QDL12270.1 lipoate--protein ligase family protein [Brasilonema sennae CENA114]QDL18650.1 lipoate--protein ligase family protein [Brasilonema octagenarum UFV-E1]
MAIDSWLLKQHQSGHPPALRFYTWSPPAISLGYHQHKYPEHWQHLVWQGEKVDLVRRPTGGRAVLHQGDLTYAVVTSDVTSGIVGSRVQVYQKICEFLIQGWRSLGIELQYGTAGRGYIHNPNCFGTATGADLILPDGTKLIGSAQLRRGGAILQHGSMRLHPSAELFTQVFGTESFSPVHFPQNLDIEKIIAALIAAAEDCFGMELKVQPISESEWEAILS